MGFFDDGDFAQRARSFGQGKKANVFFNQKVIGENGEEIKSSKKRVDFEDGSFIEEIRDGKDIRTASFEIMPNKKEQPTDNKDKNTFNNDNFNLFDY